jgi:hypothetical protein
MLKKKKHNPPSRILQKSYSDDGTFLYFLSYEILPADKGKKYITVKLTVFAQFFCFVYQRSQQNNVATTAEKE